MYAYLGKIAISSVIPGHGFQPGMPKFWRAGVGIRQAMLQIDQHLWIIIVLAHLRGCHQDRSYPLIEILHLHWETCALHNFVGGCVAVDQRQ